MKRFTFILCILFVLSLCGCSLFTPQPVEPTTEPTKPANVIETKYYTVTLPEDWVDACTYTVYPADEEGPDTLVLSETESYHTEYGGHLCSISLIPHGEDYSYFPSYEWIGMLETPEGDFDIVVLYPTDVQFSDETAQAYHNLANKVEDVINTLTPNDGIGMMMP